MILRSRIHPMQHFDFSGTIKKNLPYLIKNLNLDYDVHPVPPKFHKHTGIYIQKKQCCLMTEVLPFKKVKIIILKTVARKF